MLFWILASVTLLLGTVTLLPLSSHPHWLVRTWDFPRLQLAVLAALLLLLSGTLLDTGLWTTWLLVGVAAACLGYHLVWILPFSPLLPVEVPAAPADVPAEQRLCILTSNVLTTNRNTGALIDLVQQHKPDLFITLESDQWWQDQLEPHLGDYPHAMRCPLDNLYGMHLWSRLPLEDAETTYLVEDDVPSMHARVRLRSGAGVRLHVLHPAPPSPTENEESGERDAELIVVARAVAEEDGPVVVTGDMNDVAWSRTTRLFRKLSRLLDPRIGRGIFSTFHAQVPVARWPLDHLFSSDHFTLVRLERLPGIGSDHFPLLAELALTPAAEGHADAPVADAADRALADERVAEQSVTKADVPRP